MRNEHEFQFSASEISDAAADEADYHEKRIAYWEDEYEKAIATVEATASVEVKRRDITGGQTVDVVVNYGDYDAYLQMQRAFKKIATHRDALERFQSDEQVYATQGDRVYELSLEDVHYYRLGGGPRED